MKKDMKVELHTRTPSVARTESPTMVEIIEKFHRIKEQRFKSRENIYLTQNSHFDGRFQRHSDPDISQRNIDRPTSATQKMRTFLTASVTPRRRNSLPSLFKLDTPPSLQNRMDKSRETQNNKGEQSRKVARRYSTSHTLQEYSKRDIKQLIRAGRRASLEPLVVKPNDPIIAKPDKLILTKSVEEEEEEMKKWLTGDDLHYFYTMWDIKKKHKLRLPKKLPPVHNCVNDITVEDVDRPRLYTL